MEDRHIETALFEWVGITIEVRFEAEWLGSTDPAYRTAHLDVTAITPPRSPLPFSETGYRSRFLPADEVAAYGGPEAYVRAWLDHEAKRPAWKAHVAASKQLSLF